MPNGANVSKMSNLPQKYINRILKPCLDVIDERQVYKKS